MKAAVHFGRRKTITATPYPLPVSFCLMLVALHLGVTPPLPFKVAMWKQCEAHSHTNTAVLDDDSSRLISRKTL